MSLSWVFGGQGFPRGPQGLFGRLLSLPMQSLRGYEFE